MSYYPQPGYAPQPGYGPQPGYARAPAPQEPIYNTAAKSYPKVTQCICTEAPIQKLKARCVYCCCVGMFACCCCKEPVYGCPNCQKNYPDVAYLPC